MTGALSAAVILALWAWWLWRAFEAKARRSEGHHYSCRCDDCMPPGMGDGSGVSR